MNVLLGLVVAMDVIMMPMELFAGLVLGVRVLIALIAVPVMKQAKVKDGEILKNASTEVVLCLAHNKAVLPAPAQEIQMALFVGQALGDLVSDAHTVAYAMKRVQVERDG